MPLFGFKSQFAPAVESGAKRQTIRAHRKHDPKPGQIAYCYEHLRQKNCRKLGQWEIKGVFNTIIRIDEFEVGKIGNIRSKDVCDIFARNDGFKNWNEMRDWFKETHGLPFEGTLTQW